MFEEWRPVVGHESHYEVSNYGEVRSIKRGGVMKQQANNHGYMYVRLRFGPSVKAYIHRLVADAFIPNSNPNVNTVVNHLDFNPRNNRADNLEWTTHKGNVQYSVKAGRYERTDAWISHLRGHNEKNGRPVIGRNIKTGAEISFPCLNDCRNRGFEPSCVCLCCQGKRKTHKGYTWRYANA